MRGLFVLSVMLAFCSRLLAVPVLILPSAEVSSEGDTIVPFLTPFDADVPSLPPQFQSGWWTGTLLRFPEWDTRYVDLAFRGGELEVEGLLSGLRYSSGVPLTFVSLDRPAGMDQASQAGNYYRGLDWPDQNGFSRRYRVELDIYGSGRNPLRISNIWTTGRFYSHMKLVIHGRAIAEAGGSYQLETMMTGFTFRNAEWQWVDLTAEIRGGRFTTVPEPSSVVALLGGVVWELGRRKFRQRCD